MKKKECAKNLTFDTPSFSTLILTCERASLSFSFGPNEVLSVAVLQSRLGQMRKLMGRMGRIRRMGENAV